MGNHIVCIKNTEPLLLDGHVMLFPLFRMRRHAVLLALLQHNARLQPGVSPLKLQTLQATSATLEPNTRQLAESFCDSPSYVRLGDVMIMAVYTADAAHHS